jgi:flavin-dependent dehydrogenase
MSHSSLPIAASAPTSSEPDVFIAGGGPAGLACAIAAAQRGLTVEVVDGMKPPIDKACGEGLMPGTIDALARLGIDVSAAESAIFRGIRFLTSGPSEDSVIAQAAFSQSCGRGMRRTILHQLLLDRATALGVRFSWQTVVLGIQASTHARSEVRTNRHTIRPRYIVGADGHQSLIRSWASLDHGSASARRIGLCQHFAIAPWSHFVDVHWSDTAQAYVTPISATEVSVAFVARRKLPSIEHALNLFPLLRQRLRSAIPVGSARGSITLNRELRRVTSGNVALVGDASGSVDAVTGEGLGLCFRQALALGDALHSGNLNQYQRAHLAMQRLPSFMARAMLLMDASPLFRRHTISLLARHPRLFNQLLGIHVGHAPIRVFGSNGLLATGVRLLAG